MDFKNSIHLGVQVDPQNNVEQKINTIIEKLNNKKIELDLTIKDTNVASQLETLTKLVENFKASIGEDISLGNIGTSIKEAIESMAILNKEMGSLNFEEIQNKMIEDFGVKSGLASAKQFSDNFKNTIKESLNSGDFDNILAESVRKMDEEIARVNREETDKMRKQQEEELKGILNGNALRENAKGKLVASGMKISLSGLEFDKSEMETLKKNFGKYITIDDTSMTKIDGIMGELVDKAKSFGRELGNSMNPRDNVLGFSKLVAEYRELKNGNGQNAGLSSEDEKNVLNQTIESANELVDRYKVLNNQKKLYDELNASNKIAQENEALDKQVDKLNKEVEAIEKVNIAMQETNRIKTTVTKNNDTESTKYSNTYGSLEGTRTDSVTIDKDGGMSGNITKTIEDLAKLNKALKDITNAEKELKNLSANGLVDLNKLSETQSMLKNIFNNPGDYTNSELQKELDTVKQLSEAEKTIIKYNNEATNMKSSLADFTLPKFDGAYDEKVLNELIDKIDLAKKDLVGLSDVNLNGLKMKFDDLKKEVQNFSKETANSQKVMVSNDKADKEQEMIYQHQIEYLKQIDVLKKNGILNNNDITKLESMVNNMDKMSQMHSIGMAFGDLTKKESGISSLNKQLDNTMLNLEKMQTRFGSKMPDGYFDSVKSSLTKLREELKTISDTNLNGIRDKLNSLTTSMNQTKETMRESSGFFTGISDFLAKTGLFYGTMQVAQEITQQFKEAYQYTVEMDKAMTNMQMITGQSKGQIEGLVKSYKDLGEALHTTNQEMMGGMEEVTRAGIQGDEGKSMMESSVIGSKISGQSTQQTMEQLIAVKNAFNMTGQSMEGVVDMISKMDNVSATSFKEIADAIQRTAYSAQQAGTPLSNLVTYITTVSEKTRKSAETIGESFKTIYSRYSNIKLGKVDEDGADINDTEKAMKRIGIEIRDSKYQFREFDDVLNEFMEKYKAGQLTQVDYLAGVQALAGTRQRETLMALVENMDTLNRHQQEVAQSAGSAKRMFDSAYSDSLDARINDLKRAFEGLYERITSSGALKAGLSVLTSFINTFANIPTVIATVTTALFLFKGQAIMGLVQGLGASVTSILAYESALAGTTITLGSVTGATTLLSYAFNTLKIAIATNPIGMLALVLGTAVVAMDLFGDSAEKAGQKAKDALSNYSTEAQNISDANKLLEQKNNLESQISATNEGTEKNAQLKQELLNVERQLAQVLPETANGYDSEGKAISTNNELIQKQIDLKRQASVKQDFDALKSNSKYSFGSSGMNFSGDLTTMMDTAKKFEEMKNNAQKDYAEAGNAFTKWQASNAIKTTTDMSNDINSQLANVRLLIIQLQGAGKSYADIAHELGVSEEAIEKIGESYKTQGTNAKQASNDTATLTSAVKELSNNTFISDGTVKSLIQAFPDMGINATNAGDKVKAFGDELNRSNDLIKEAKGELDKNSLSDSTLAKLNEAFPQLGINSENAKQKVETLNGAIAKMSAEPVEQQANAIEKATKDYDSATQQIAKAQIYLDKLNKSNEVTPQLVAQMTKNYGDLGTAVNSVSTLQDFLTSKIKDQQLAQEEAYEVMKGDDEQFYQDKIAHNENFKSAYNNLLNSFLADGEQAYNVDLGNYKTLNQLKQGTQNDLGVAITNWLSQFVDNSSGAYNIDFSNFKSFAEAKAKILEKLQADIKMVTDQMNNAIKSAKNYADQVANGDTSESGMSDDGSKFQMTESEARRRSTANANYADSLANKLGNLNTAYEKVNTSFDQFQGSMNGFRGGMGADSDFSGTGGSGGGSGKSAADKAEEWAKKINELSSKIDTDPLYDYNNAVQAVTNSLEENQEAEKVLTGAELQKSLAKDIELMKEKQKTLEGLKNAEQGQADSLKSYLQQYGFYFDATGQLINSQQRLQEIEATTNAMAGDSEADYNKKKEWIEWVKELSSKSKEYVDLINSKIPGVKKQWQELGNTIQETARKQVQTLREDLVNALKQDIQDEYDDKLEKLQTKYDKKKENLQSEYEEEKENLQDEKETDAKNYQDEIDALQDQLEKLNDDSADKKLKLAKYQSELAKWKLDDSVFAQQKIKELTEKIAETEKDIQKDNLQDQIDVLNDKKDASSTYYDDELKELEDNHKDELDELEKSNDKQVKAVKKKYDKMLEDKELYKKADKLIEKNNQDEMLELLSKYSDSYKDVGTLLGENFKEGFIAQIKSAMEDFKNLTDDSTGSSSGGSNSGGEVKVGDYVTVSNSSGEMVDVLSNGTAMSSSGTLGAYSGEKLKTVGYDNGYFQLADESGNILGWSRRDDIARYATGGRVPDNVGSDGKLAVLDAGEKVLTRDDTIMTGRIFDYVEQNVGVLNNVDSMLNQLSEVNGLVSSQNSSIPTLGDISSSSDNRSIHLENNINVTNNTKDDSYFNARSLDRMWKQQTRKFK